MASSNKIFLAKKRIGISVNKKGFQIESGFFVFLSRLEGCTNGLSI